MEDAQPIEYRSSMNLASTMIHRSCMKASSILWSRMPVWANVGDEDEYRNRIGDEDESDMWGNVVSDYSDFIILFSFHKTCPGFILDRGC